MEISCRILTVGVATCDSFMQAVESIDASTLEACHSCHDESSCCFPRTTLSAFTALKSILSKERGLLRPHGYIANTPEQTATNIETQHVSLEDNPTLP